ncbi:nSTAND3 domain-containing NTPase [Spirosoma radiotolerans]|uniref:Uncharacterized protein n=1 Tax=Spirosoma radiotolerans TaxID=1379870 RepID=A0A0E3ZYG0_9BACT|nr:restriction endonuclease [Spirosoma radiotolerans]AKD56984.1 hypothetical protein SD10_20840 [Spirosoma radiotolerans]
MLNYDFQILSPIEFEEISRDLIQNHLNIFLESFTDGKDGGIDFRYSSTKENAIIVQCKRYKTFKDLIYVLKREANVLDNLSPSKYIITTSVGLTPMQKKEIKELFKKYIKSTKDILGRNDLNNLLGKNPEIEKKYYKLWISSFNILNNILHSKVYNESNFDKDTIKSIAERYVMNPSYSNAIKILNEKRYVIITGIPGIGKSTLARMLAYKYLGEKKCNEYVYMSTSVDEGTEVFSESESQFFLFDDFLGGNFLDNNLKINEEKKIVSFIEKISKSSNKFLILTSREYIYRQAKAKFEIFNRKDLEISNCVIDLENYTKLVRAKIFYNFLVYNNVDYKFIENTTFNGNYNKIINHPNFNPRILDIYINHEYLKTINPSEFTAKIMEFLSNPEQVWQAVFENHITNLSRCILTIILTTGTPIAKSDLNQLIGSFSEKYSNKYNVNSSTASINLSIKELENTFINVRADDNLLSYIEFKNPSVKDFLMYYYKDESIQIEDTIDVAIFINQLIKPFTKNYVTEYDDKSNETFKEFNLVLTKRIKQIILNKVFNNFDDIPSSTLRRRFSRIRDYKNEFMNSYVSRANILDDLLDIIPISESNLYKNFVIVKFNEIAENNDELIKDPYSFILLAEKLGAYYEGNKIKFLQRIIQNLKSLDMVELFYKLKNNFHEEFEFVTNNEFFRYLVTEWAKIELRNKPIYINEDTLQTISKIAKYFNLDYGFFHNFAQQIDDEITENQYKDFQEHNSDIEDEINVDSFFPEDIDSKISEMFSSLKASGY